MFDWNSPYEILFDLFYFSWRWRENVSNWRLVFDARQNLKLSYKTGQIPQGIKKDAAYIASSKPVNLLPSVEWHYPTIAKINDYIIIFSDLHLPVARF